MARILPATWEEVCRFPFCVVHPPRLSRTAGSLLAAAPWISHRVAELLGGPLPWTTVALTDQMAEFRRLVPPGARPPHWAAALAFGRMRYVVLGPEAVLAPRARLVRILAHEYSHVALAHRLGPHRVPRWFAEGLADLQALLSGPLDPFAVGREIPLRDLAHRFPRSGDLASQAYAQSRDFVAYLYRLRGPEGIRRLVGLLGRGVPLEKAIQQIYGQDIREISARWRREWRYRNVLLPLLTSGALLWMGAAVLLVAGYVRRRRRMRAMPESEEQEPFSGGQAQAGPPPAKAPPAAVVLSALGLAALLAALLETVFPRVSWVTLLLAAGIPVSLVFILLWRAGKISEDAAEQERPAESGPDPDEP